MTQKELLYLEDAIGHEKSIRDILSISISNVIDEDLKSFLSNELKIHEELENDMINFLEAKNE